MKTQLLRKFKSHTFFKNMFKILFQKFCESRNRASGSKINILCGSRFYGRGSRLFACGSKKIFPDPRFFLADLDFQNAVNKKKKLCIDD